MVKLQPFNASCAKLLLDGYFQGKNGMLMCISVYSIKAT